MFQFKNFKLYGIFTCPRCGTPCYSTCCGTATTTASNTDFPKCPDCQYQSGRKRKKPTNSHINATMADKSVSKTVAPDVVPENSGELQEQETSMGFSRADNSMEINYRAGDPLVPSYSVATPLADLQLFLSRPLLVYNFIWQVGTPLASFKLKVWQRFITNARVREKLALFKLLRGTLKTRILVNGTPFHYGLIQVGMYPGEFSNMTTNILPETAGSILNYDDSGGAAAWTPARTFYTQRPHTFINPRTNTSNLISWPFFDYRTFGDLAKDYTNSGQHLGFLEFVELNGLAMSNNGTDDAEVSILCWMEDVQLVGMDINTTATGNDEYAGDGVVSGPATALARFSARFTGNSYIGKFARATEIGSNAVASIASLFGFSKPAIIDKPCVIAHINAGHMPNTAGHDPLIKLSLDPKQELSIDPSLLDLPQVDEMSFDYIVKRETLFYQQLIQTNNVGHLCGWSVSPTLGPILDASSVSGVNQNCMFMSPMGYVATPFREWRGSMVFRLQFVCSAMHRGRFLITYTPSSACTMPLDPDLNGMFNHVIDISEETDVSFEVKWSQQTPFRKVKAFDALTRNVVCTGSSRTLTLEDVYCNGRLDIYVLNRLVAPVSSAEIYVNLWVRGGDDFDVMNPSEEMYQFSYSYDGGLYSLPNASMGDIAIYNRKDCEDEPLQCTSVILNDNFAQVDSASIFSNYAGEQIRSVRALIKRFTPHNSYYQTFAADSKFNNYSIIQPNFPIGRSLAAYGQSGNDQTLSGSYVWNTHLRWFVQGYIAAKGGIRWLWVVNTLYGRTNAAVFRRATTNATNITTFAITAPTALTDFQVTNLMQSDFATTGASYAGHGLGLGGIQNYSTQDSTLLMYEVPYYSLGRYSDVSQTGANADYDVLNAAHNISIDVPADRLTVDNLVLRSYVSAAEDTQFHFLVGFPPIYIQIPKAYP